VDFVVELLAFLVTLGILVTFHEWGHFFAARKLGVKVLRFSVGFGKPLWRKVGKDGVEYVVAGIPLGGYVKMLDEREAEVPESLAHQAFNRQPLWKRNIIVLAGPVANFVLAILVFWLMFMMGVVTLKPELGQVAADSLAAQSGLRAGDRIIAIDGEPVTDWQDTQFALAKRMGDAKPIEMMVQRDQQQVSLVIDTTHWRYDDRRPDLLDSLGLKPSRPDVILGEIVEGMPAAQAGLQPGDKVVKIDDAELEGWQDFVTRIQSSNGRSLSLTVIRKGQPVTVTLVPEKTEDGYKIGAGLDRDYLKGFYDERLIIKKYDVFAAFSAALERFWDMIGLTVTFIKKLILGEVSTKSLGGPLAIAEGAGSSARGGLVIFLGFLGMISVNLGLINLLPVPVLDGGHLLFNIMEAIKGKPLSEATQEYGMRIGMVLVLGLMAIAIINDFARL
jgi:regulator of sigma E protease